MKRLLCLLLVSLLLSETAIAWTAQESYGDFSELPEGLTSILPEEVQFIYGLRHANTTYILAGIGEKTWKVLIYRREPGRYVLECQSAYLSELRDATPHIGCSGPDALHLIYDDLGMSFGFGRLEDGKWVLRSIQGQDVFSMNPAEKEVKCFIDKEGKKGSLRGAYDEIFLSSLDMEHVPLTFKEAFSLVNTDGYAIVKAIRENSAALHEEPMSNSALVWPVVQSHRRSCT